MPFGTVATSKKKKKERQSGLINQNSTVEALHLFI